MPGKKISARSEQISVYKIMEELIKTFHIDWKLLIAQTVNFAIVLLVLWRYALKPLTVLMDKRSKEIAKSLDDAKVIEVNLAKSRKEKEEIILTAKKEAQTIIEQSRLQGQKQGQELLEKSKEDVQAVITEAKRQIVQEKEKMLETVKQEVGSLVIEATAKVFKELANEDLDEKMVKNMLVSLEQERSGLDKIKE